ncbi:MAG: hypothetical protein V4574_01795 [Pseudomonadota bacterium]
MRLNRRAFLGATPAHDVIVDHCPFARATDENLPASGLRFGGGETVEAWRARTSRRISFTSNIVAEGLSHSSHAKGEHSKGSLIHDNVTDVLIAGNLYAHNYERNQLFKGGAHAASANNPEGFHAIPASQVEAQVLAEAGARPHDRGAVDRRIVEQVRRGTGRVIDDGRDVGGYPR